MTLRLILTDIYHSVLIYYISVLLSFVRICLKCIGMSHLCVFTLNVIVECEVLVSVFVQKTEGVGVGKILKLDEAFHPIPVQNRETSMYCIFFPKKEKNVSLVANARKAPGIYAISFITCSFRFVFCIFQIKQWL